MTIAYSLDNIRNNPPALFCKYPLQLQPQAAYVTLDAHGVVTADYTGDVGNTGTPAHVWHGRAYRFRVSSYVNAALLAEWLEDTEARTLLERICAGHSIEWDGNNNVGRLTDDADRAHDAFAEALGAFGNDTEMQIWDATDWISDAPLWDLWPADQTAQQSADSIMAAAQDDGVYIHDSVLDALLAFAAGFFDIAGDDPLRADQVAELVAADLISKDDADARANQIA